MRPHDGEAAVLGYQGRAAGAAIAPIYADRQVRAVGSSARIGIGHGANHERELLAGAEVQPAGSQNQRQIIGYLRRGHGAAAANILDGDRGGMRAGGGVSMRAADIEAATLIGIDDAGNSRAAIAPVNAGAVIAERAIGIGVGKTCDHHVAERRAVQRRQKFSLGGKRRVGNRD